MIGVYATAHRSLLFSGILMALLIVFVRVSLPWLFKWILDNWLTGDVPGLPAWTETLGTGWTIGIIILAMAALLGFADHSARLFFARFSIATTRDLRSGAFTALKQRNTLGELDAKGDLIARLIGDTARMKTGLKGFLVHVAVNGLLLLCIASILMSIDLALGAIFIAGFLAVLAVTFVAALLIYRKALQFRTKEGSLAEMIETALNKPASHHYANYLNDSSGKNEAALTRLQGYATWFAHIAFGMIILFTVVTGMTGLSTGMISTGELVLFLLYGLSIRAPMVQLSRQGARTGKIFATGYRLCQLVHEPAGSAKQKPDKDWMDIRLKGIKLRGTRHRGAARRLGPLDLTIRKGEKLLVVGSQHAGKTALLEVIANNRKPSRGKRYWNGVNYRRLDKYALHREILFIEEDVRWPKTTLKRLLGLTGDTLSQDQIILLQLTGLASEGVALNLDKKMNPRHFSPAERRLIGMCLAAFSEAEVILMDNLLSEVNEKKCQEILHAFRKIRPDSTLVLTSRRTLLNDFFDRVIELRKGKMRQTETPAQQPA